MHENANSAGGGALSPEPSKADGGLSALCQIAGFYRVAADPLQLHHDIGLGARSSTGRDLCHAAALLGLKSRIIRNPSAARIRRLPTPTILALKAGGYAILLNISDAAIACLIEPHQASPRHVALPELMSELASEVILIARQDKQPEGSKPFGLKWFVPSIVRHKKAIGHVLVASLFVQMFALVTPLFFQIVVDKVVTHKGTSTLLVVTAGMLALGMFNVILQYLRSYALSHTTTRIDVELGSRLFHHLLRLPLGYFESRAAGQTVARLRELDTIRSFITGQALFSVIDLVFAAVFVGMMFVYSPFLALLVLCSVPAYALITAMIRPLLRDRIREQFQRGALSQQFLVESVVGIHTLKAAAVEPAMQAVWEEKLTAYVKSAFQATMLGTLAQNSIQYVSSATTAATIFFGARFVMDGSLTVGQLIAFNMIAAQLTQPILRLSQLFQDFQQVQVSVERLGDVLDTPVEPQATQRVALPPIKGSIEFRNVGFRYRPDMPPTLREISCSVRPGETIGIVGPSGSGKSTLSKLIQRFYIAESGQIFVDGIDLANADPSWLRRQIGVVLQENTLFNLTIHENIAFSDPTMSRAHVIKMAQMSGAHGFISALPAGYDTMVEERGTNFSGGQRQRIAIARALANNPRILIFDEATSALDYESEQLIQANMAEIVRGRTVIVIAHRLSTVRQCDRIISMKDGRIVEIGSHDDLMRQDQGLYSYLWGLQSGRIAAVQS